VPTGEHGVLTGRCELRVDALAHDALQTEARTHEADGCERARIMPRHVAAAVRDGSLVRRLRGDRRTDSQERLEHGTQEEPRASLGAHTVADAAEERAEDEAEDRAEGLLVCEVEGGIMVPRGPLKQTSESYGKLAIPSVSYPG
jgi:hypothetical protein